MIKKSKLKLAAIAGVSALLLSGCAFEYLDADGDCADFTTESNPPLYADVASIDATDIYFDVESTGSYDAIYSYLSIPDPGPLVSYVEPDWILGDTPDGVPVWRWTEDVVGLSFDVTTDGSHRISMPITLVGALIESGMGIPVAVVATCDDTAYRAGLPTTSPTDVSGDAIYVSTSATDTNVERFFPGQELDHVASQISAGGVVDLDFESGLNIDTAIVVVIPWAEEWGAFADATVDDIWTAYVLAMNSMPDGFESSYDVGDYVDVTGSSVTANLSGATRENLELWLGETGLTLAGAAVLITSIEEESADLLRIRYSYTSANFAADGTLSAAPTATEYTGPQYNDDQLKGKPGEQVTLTGTNMKVNSATIGGKSTRIVSNTATSLTLEIPADLAGGRYDVSYTFAGGEVTRQLGATVIDHSVWTKRLSDSQAKLYAKNVAGAGKVTFNLNGREIAWVNAVDASDPKLRKANGDHYLVRTVNLKAGKNVLEIFVDGIRERRTVYTR